MADCSSCLCRTDCLSSTTKQWKCETGSWSEKHCLRYRRATKRKREYYDKLVDTNRKKRYYNRFEFDAKAEHDFLKEEIWTKKHQTKSYEESLEKHKKNIEELEKCLEEFEKDYIAELVAAEI